MHVRTCLPCSSVWACGASQYGHGNIRPYFMIRRPPKQTKNTYAWEKRIDLPAKHDPDFLLAFSSFCPLARSAFVMLHNLKPSFSSGPHLLATPNIFSTRIPPTTTPLRHHHHSYTPHTQGRPIPRLAIYGSNTQVHWCFIFYLSSSSST
jgi:hypothetical protein